MVPPLNFPPTVSPPLHSGRVYCSLVGQANIRYSVWIPNVDYRESSTRLWLQPNEWIQFKSQSTLYFRMFNPSTVCTNLSFSSYDLLVPSIWSHLTWSPYSNIRRRVPHYVIFSVLLLCSPVTQSDCDSVTSETVFLLWFQQVCATSVRL